MSGAPLVPKTFAVTVAEDALASLRARLAFTRVPDALVGTGRAYGTELALVQRLVARWKDGYDWRARETQINSLPMFTLPVDVSGFGALDVHFVHQRSTVVGAIPLLFVHGCRPSRNQLGIGTRFLLTSQQGRDTLGRSSGFCRSSVPPPPSTPASTSWRLVSPVLDSRKPQESPGSHCRSLRR
jgi:hypothetical protein